MRFKARFYTVCITLIVVLQLCQGGDPEEEHPEDLLSHDNPQNVIADANLPPEFATLPSKELPNPDELKTSNLSSKTAPKANNLKKTTTCATDDGGLADSFVTPSDSEDAPPPNNKAKTTTPDPLAFDNIEDPPVDIPAKKKNVTTTESDGSNDESFLTTPADSGEIPPKVNKPKKTTTCATDDSGPADSFVTPSSDSEDAPPPKQKPKTTTPDPFGKENAADIPDNIPPKKNKNTSSDDSDLAKYLNELKKPIPTQKGYSSSNGELDVKYRSLLGDVPAIPASNDLKTEKENIVNAPKNGDTNETLNPLVGSKNKPQTNLNNDMLIPGNVGNNSKGKPLTQDPSENHIAEHETMRNEIVLTPKNQASGSPNNGANKNELPYSSPKLPKTDPSGVNSPGISRQQISPNGPLPFGNNEVNSFGSNVPKSPQVGSPSDGLSQSGKSQQPLSPKQPGTLGSNFDKTIAYAPKNTVGSPDDGLNQNVKSPQQISPKIAQEPGVFGNNLNKTNAYTPNSPPNPQGVNSLSDGLNTYGKAPQPISPNGPGTVGNNGVGNSYDSHLTKYPQVGSPVDEFNTNGKLPQQISPKSAQQPGILDNDHSPNSPPNPQEVNSLSDGLNTYGKAPQPISPNGPGTLGNNGVGNGYGSHLTKSPQEGSPVDGLNTYGKSPQQVSPKNPEQPDTLGKNLETNAYGNAYNPNAPKNSVMGSPADGINQNGKSPQQVYSVSPKGVEQLGPLGNNLDESYGNSPKSPKNTQLMGSPVNGFNQNGIPPHQISPKGAQQLGDLGNSLDKTNAYSPNSPKNPQELNYSPIDGPNQYGKQSPKGSQQAGFLGNNLDETNGYNSNGPKNPQVVGSPVEGPSGKLPQQISPQSAMQTGTYGNNLDEPFVNSPNAPKNPQVVNYPSDGLDQYSKLPQQISPKGVPQPGTMANNYQETNAYGNVYTPNLPKNSVGAPGDGLISNEKPPQQLPGKSAQQQGPLGHNLDTTKTFGNPNNPNSPIDPKIVNYPVDGFNQYGNSPQEISPKGPEQPINLGKNQETNTLGTAYNPNAPKNPQVVGSPVEGPSGKLPQQISPKSAMETGISGNNIDNTNTYNPNATKNPVGAPVGGLNTYGKLPQQMSPKTVQQPGTLGSNPDEINSYGNAFYDPNALKNPQVVGSPVNGLNQYGVPPKQMSPKTAQQPGTLGNNLGEIHSNNPTMPKNLQSGNYLNDGLINNEKQPQQLSPKGPQKTGSLGNNLEETSAYNPNVQKNPQLLNAPPDSLNQYGKSPQQISPKGVQQPGILGNSFDESNKYGNANNPTLPKNLVGAPVEGLNTHDNSPQKMGPKSAQQPGTLGNSLDQTYSNGLDSPNNPQVVGSPVDGFKQYGKPPQQLPPKTAPQPGTLLNKPIGDGDSSFGNSPQQKGAPFSGYSGNSPSGSNNGGASPYGGLGTGSMGGKTSNGTNAMSNPNGPLNKPKDGSVQTTTSMSFDDEIPPGPKVVPVGLDLKPDEMKKLCALPPLPKGENICYQRNKKNSNTLDTWVKICETIATSIGYCQGLCLYIESPIDTGIYYSVCGISKSNTSDTSDTSTWVYLTTQDIPILLPPDQTCPNNRYKVLHETVSAPRK